MNLSLFEPFGMFSLTGGLIYSIIVFILNVEDYKFHFVFQTVIIFLALFIFASYKYLKYRFTCETMDEIIGMMKNK